MFVFVVVCVLMLFAAIVGLVHDLASGYSEVPVTAIGVVAAMFMWGVVLIVLQFAQ